MTTLKVPEMMCQNCVKRITNALNGENLKFTVSLDTKSVSLEDDAAVKKAIDTLANVGFDAEPA